VNYRQQHGTGSNEQLCDAAEPALEQTSGIYALFSDEGNGKLLFERSVRDLADGLDRASEKIITADVNRNLSSARMHGINVHSMNSVLTRVIAMLPVIKPTASTYTAVVTAGASVVALGTKASAIPEQ
jgi:hypothetical protein